MKLNFLKKWPFISFRQNKNRRYMTNGGFINITNSLSIKNPRDLQIIFNDRGDSCLFAIICPKCKKLMSVTSNHTKTFDREGKLTIEPSILHERCDAHYYIVKNEILYV